MAVYVLSRLPLAVYDVRSNDVGNSFNERGGEDAGAAAAGRDAQPRKAREWDVDKPSDPQQVSFNVQAL